MTSPGVRPTIAHPLHYIAHPFVRVPPPSPCLCYNNIGAHYDLPTIMTRASSLFWRLQTACVITGSHRAVPIRKSVRVLVVSLHTVDHFPFPPFNNRTTGKFRLGFRVYSYAPLFGFLPDRFKRDDDKYSSDIEIFDIESL